MALAVIGPIVGVWWGKLLVIVGAYVLTLGLGSRVVLHFVSAPASESQSAPEDADRPGAAPGPPKPRYDA